MIIEDGVNLLRLMGVSEQEIVVDEDRGWIRSSCPLAPGTHKDGVDNHPSFGIQIKEADFSTYKCFTCGRGTVSDLVHKYNFAVPNRNKDVSTYYLQCGYGESTEHKIIEYTDRYSTLELSKNPVPMPDEVLKTYPLLAETIGGKALSVREWLLGRGIALQVAYDYGTRMDKHGNVAFPITDTDNRIYAMHMRSLRSKDFWHAGNPKEGIRYYKPGVWFGAHRWDRNQPTITVESQTDVLRLKTIDPSANVLGSCGPITNEHLDRLCLTRRIILGYDSDPAGVKYCIRTIRGIPDGIHTFSRLVWSSVGIKDAGELKGQLDWIEVLNNQRDIVIRNNQIGLRTKDS